MNRINKLIIFALLIISQQFIYSQSINNNVNNGSKNYVTTRKIKYSDFSFAQFSDLHISPNNQIHCDDLIAAVDDVNENSNIAFVIVSGDISETGDYQSLITAKKILDKLKCPYYIVPGNHDTKWTESGATDFKKIFGDNNFRLQFNGIVFLGINSGPILKMGDGHIAPQDIIWVKRQLKNVGKRVPVFMVTHYPLQTGDVDNWYDLTDVIRKYNIQGVLGGHYHRNLLNNYDGIPGVITRSTLRAKEDKGGYTLYHIQNDSIYINEKIIGEKEALWATLPIEQKIYVEGDEKEFPRPSYEINSQYKNIKDVWSISSGHGIYSSASVCENSLFFGDDSGVLNCYSIDKGKLFWNYQTMARIASTPAIAGNKIIFGSCDNNIYCLDKNNGSLIWKIKTNKAVFGTPIIKDNIAYIGASDGKFRAINIDTKEIIWSFDSINNYQESRPVIYKNLIIFGAWDSYLYALNIENGSLAWKWNNGNTRPHFAPAAVYPVVSHDKVFITAPDRFMTAIDVNSGKTVWRTKEHMVRETIGISNDKNVVYSRCMNDSVFALDVTADAIKLRWKINADFGYDHNPSMLIENNGRVVFGTKNGEIICIDANNGDIIWKHKIGNSIINTMTPISATDWIVTTTDGVIVRLNTKE